MTLALCSELRVLPFGFEVSMGQSVNSNAGKGTVMPTGAVAMDDAEFFSRVEALVQQAEVSESYRSNKELDWDIFLEPLLWLISKFVTSGGQQDPDRPGKIRLDMGRPRSGGGLEPNPDTILVVDFDCGGDAEALRFFAKYDLAEELLRYAAVGEQGWDVRRQ